MCISVGGGCSAKVAVRAWDFKALMTGGWAVTYTVTQKPGISENSSTTCWLTAGLKISPRA